MTGNFNPELAAEFLAGVWHGSQQIAELPTAMRPIDIGQGYDIQDRLVKKLGDPVVGWKLGVGSTKLKQQSGVGRSIAGRILGSRRHDPGAHIRLSFAAPVTIESQSYPMSMIWWSHRAGTSMEGWFMRNRPDRRSATWSLVFE